MKLVRMVLTFAFLSVAVCMAQDSPSDSTGFATLAGPYLGQKPPGIVPEQFAPDIIPIEDIEHCFPTFSSDGREVFWMTLKRGSKPKIMHMKEVDGHWTPPEVAPFAGEHSDMQPVFSPDGTRLYYASARPGGFGKLDIWYVERKGDGWGEPVNLGAPPNTADSETQSTFTADGTVYFLASMDSVEWERDIYRCRHVDGQYLAREALNTVINSKDCDAYPFIAPDESYLMFGSCRPGGKSVETDAYISFRDDDGSWSEPRHMGDAINNGKSVSFPYLSIDGKYLFFERFIEGEGGADAFFWMDSGITDSLRAAGAR